VQTTVSFIIPMSSLALVLCFSLLSSAAVQQSEYVIGSRDVLKITVWGHDDLSKEYPVDADGAVSFPLLGRVNVRGLTTTELAARLRELLGKDYLVDPHVLVAVKEYRSKKVYVFGEVEKRGVIYLTGPMTILDIISEAGGLSKTAGKHVVVLKNRRSGTADGTNTRLQLSLDKIQAGDVTENIRLDDEDTVLVPKRATFFVSGEVRTPGSFPLEMETSVLEAVTLAGGYTEKAAPSAVKLLRRSVDGKEETIPLDLSGVVPRARGFKLQDGDSVLVPRGNSFFVFGEVRRPGAYQLDKDTNILEAITIAGGFTDRAAPGRTRVIRSTPQGQRIINVDMNVVIKRSRPGPPIALQENDVVVVPESFF
jgi:polysaccharide export outer membrane protein